MKIARYAVGAVGVVPAFGLMIQAANPVGPAPHPAGKQGKIVSLQHSKTPLVNCGTRHIASDKSANGHLHGAINFSGLCVHSQWASLNKDQTGLTERTRFYSGNGKLERTTWQAGKIFSSIPLTRFVSVPNSYAHMVCQALVANGNHNDVKYGPVCETT